MHPNSQSFNSQLSRSVPAIGILIVVIIQVVILPSKERSLFLKQGDSHHRDQLSFFFRPYINITTTTHHPRIPVVNEKKWTIPQREEESFSACLLIMDENFRLPEWITFAYHSQPLRYAVFAVDPRSKHSPTPMFDMLRKELPDLTILEWTDSDFVTWDKPMPENASQTSLRERHLNRQRRFYESCLTHLYNHNRSWTALYDTDEVLVLKNATSMEQKGSIMAYIHQIEKERNITTDCFQSPRHLMGTLEIPEQEMLDSVPSLTISSDNTTVDPWRLDTLRYRFGNSHGNRENGLGKAILNVQSLATHFPLTVGSVHRPIVEVCGSAFPAYTLSSPFRINHYLGSWEAYSFRDDSRKGGERSFQAWQFKNVTSDMERNDMAATWLKGFMADVGAEKARRLLKHAGLPRTYEAKHGGDGWSFNATQATNMVHRKDRRHKQFLSFVRESRNTSQMVV